MLTKTVFVVLLATLSVSYAKDEQDELVHTVLGTGTNLMKEFSKVVAEDPDKYSFDMNAVYKKYEVAAKADQARSYLQSQFKRGAELTSEYLKKGDLEAEDNLKKTIELIKKEDSVLGDKLNKYYEKTCEIDRISEDIVKYVTDVERINGAFEKSKAALNPLFHKLSDAVKKFESIVLEHVPKKGKK